MSLLHAVILGIVEGITEFLPISSTGHLILVSYALRLPSDDFLKSFEISIQLGAILAVVVLYSKRLFIERGIIVKVLFAFLPTGALGFLFYKIVKSYLLGNAWVVLWSLFFGGIALILFERRYKEKEHATRTLSDISFRQSFFIGLIQGVSMIPGVSRAAATIAGGLIVGLDRKTVVEFSFLLAVPTMLAATGYDMLKNAALFSADDLANLAAGFVTSFIVATLAIKFLLRYIVKHDFTIFGIYRIIAAALFWFLVL